MNGDTLTIYTIYNSPADFPGDYVISKWDIIAGSNEPRRYLNYIFVNKSLQACRDELAKKRLYNLGRNEADDPCVVECWI